MINLLNAGFARLRKNKLFCMLMIFTVGLALAIVFTQYYNKKEYGEVILTEQLMLKYSTIIVFVIAIFTSLFLEAEYSNGAIRNKISIGHKRSNIYLSNLIITSITSLFSYILFIIIIAIVGIPIFGEITIKLSRLLMLLGCIFMAEIAYSSIFTLIEMVISNKTMTTMVNIMLAFGLLMIAGFCVANLNIPEYIQTERFANGEMEMIEEKNSKYSNETQRKIYQTLLDINPAGQMFQITGKSSLDLKIFPIYSLGFIIIFSGLGIILFNKKELK